MGKKYGYTLIELVVSMSIILILASIGIGASKYLLKIKKDMYIRQELYEVLDIIHYGKSYSVNSQQYGNIKFIMKDNILEVSLIINDETKRKIELDNLKLYKNYSLEYMMHYKMIFIKQDGTVESCTLIFKDSLDKMHVITISVGENNIRLKE
ncbi:prepilin-type N-terminal cleavage/methylation domain-containing protein [Clostridium sp. MSJ-8]|uniref:pilus assembly FimT family protein n=1 Tax=Clostridium sp. MSJ-8 TaxID=2841510 RepID=UPI001C0F0EAC|nr:prepilin-type N-terminal cleavage/methylation domain-containing protein [Clostridium sp. MSJ-8]MBU5487546.1 prepilin-type N-terminal cleavage/methylation domain-containing protein [Clostridium sp. MSJ-8]